MSSANPRILLCSEHCLADAASGAALSASELLRLLADRGWNVAALTGTRMDGTAHAPLGDDVRRLAASSEAAPSLAVHHLHWQGIPTRLVRGSPPMSPSPVTPGSAGAMSAAPAQSASPPPGQVAVAAQPPETAAPDPAAAALLPLPLLLDHELRLAKPDILLVYGGGWCGRAILKTARAHGIPTVFWLRNNFYRRRDLFDDVTGTIVPSVFTSKLYQQRLGLSCQVLYPTVLPDRVRCPVRQPRYLTYLAPLPEKGVFFAARLFQELARLRPDIEVLLVEGRGSFDWFRQTGLDVLSLPNVTTLPRVEDPRQFLAVTRALLFPSLWDEPFGRTAIEAMLNGVPVVASNRGGLPEVVGTGGVLLPITSRLTAESAMLATVGEVRPWIDAVARLWDDDDHYRHLAREAISSASRFNPDVIADRADELLRSWIETPTEPRPLDNSDLFRLAGYPGDVGAALAPWAGLTDVTARELLL